MRILLCLFLKDVFAATALGIGAVFNIATWILIWFGLPHADFIPLSYNIQVGINWTGPWWYAFSYPLIGICVLLLNAYLATLIFLKERNISYFLVISAAFLQGLIFSAVLAIVMLNR